MPSAKMTDAAPGLTSEERAIAMQFLGAIRYQDVYNSRFVQCWGDGNKAGSPSDKETREILRVVGKLHAALLHDQPAPSRNG